MPKLSNIKKRYKIMCRSNVRLQNYLMIPPPKKFLPIYNISLSPSVPPPSGPTNSETDFRPP